MRNVIVSLVGGLGNQLFQIAAGVTLAAESGAKLWTSGEGVGRREALWRVLGWDVPTAPRALEIRAGGVPDGLPPAATTMLKGLRVLGFSRRSLAMPVRASAFDPRPAHPPRGLTAVLRGYFQHPDWFTPSLARLSADVIRARGTAEKARETLKIVVHLRRGDYVSLGWALGLEYYVSAIRLVEAHSGIRLPVQVISDDALAASDLAQALHGQGYDVEIPQRGTGTEHILADFWSLASARVLVMSNSTFCWWATVVGDAMDAQRTVVFPAGWIGAGAEQLVQSNWISLPSPLGA